MYRIPIPVFDIALVFNPPLEIVPGGVQLLVALLIAGLLGFWIVALYRDELRVISRGRATFLLASRVALVVLLWLLTLQPALSRSRRETVPGAVMIALDQSDSMTVTDPQRGVVSKLRLARALGMVSEQVTPSRLDEWIQRETETAANRPSALPADLPERQAFDEICRQVDALPRWQIAQELLTRPPVSLIDTIATQHAVDLVGFSQRIEPLSAEQVASPSAPPSVRGAFTDLRLPMERALERGDPNRPPVMAVVLLTDGQHNWGLSPVGPASDLGKAGVPVFPVVVGADRPPKDVAITAVDAPRAVFKGSEVPVEVRVQVQGVEPRELLIQLHREGHPPLEERLFHDGRTTQYTVKFQPRLDEVGRQTLVVAARAEPGELLQENNRRPIVVNVADETADVLLVDGEARWEFHYLHTALMRDRSMKLQSVVFSQPRLGQVPEEELSLIGYPATQLPPERDALNHFDCIILGDVSPEQLPLSERQRLERYVSERGGTLVILAGKRFMPRAFSLGTRAADTDPLERLLPVSDLREVRPPEGFPVRLTAEGRLSSFLQLDSTLDRSDRIWADLPRHFWGTVGKAKPGAVTLAWYAAGDDDQERSAEQQREAALIARHFYGFGRVLFVGIDSTWRWRFKTGDQFHHKFWGQVIRWAASDKPLITGNEYVRFGTREPVYRPGQEIEFIARLSELARPLNPDALAGVRLFRKEADQSERSIALVPLTRRESRPRELETKLRDLPPGEYWAELVIPDLADQIQAPPKPDGSPGKFRAPFQVAPPDTSEMTELQANRPLLEDIAARSGGQVFEADQTSDLLERLRASAATRRVQVETRLGRSWWTLIVLTLLLTAEWVLRKWSGLP